MDGTGKTGHPSWKFRFSRNDGFFGGEIQKAKRTEAQPGPSTSDHIVRYKLGLYIYRLEKCQQPCIEALSTKSPSRGQMKAFYEKRHIENKNIIFFGRKESVHSIEERPKFLFSLSRPKRSAWKVFAQRVPHFDKLKNFSRS